MKLSAFRN